jgi:hypothetical protein
MGMFEKIRSSLSPQARLLAELAVTAGGYETLATNLKRHAELCTYPTLRAGLERLAAAEAAQERKLRAVLLDRGVWPRPSSEPQREGFSNWERIGSDLALGSKLFRDLNWQIVEWETVEPEFATWLREFVAEEDGNLGLMRDLGLKCDPLALD